MASAKQIVATVVAVVLGVYVIASLAPDALETIMDVNTTGWDATVATLWEVIPIMAVLALVVIVIVLVLDKLKG